MHAGGTPVPAAVALPAALAVGTGEEFADFNEKAVSSDPGESVADFGEEVVFFDEEAAGFPEEESVGAVDSQTSGSLLSVQYVPSHVPPRYYPEREPRSLREVRYVWLLSVLVLTAMAAVMTEKKKEK